MKTTSVMLQTLAVPCACRCRYCLLSWDGRCLGADYARSEAYARRFHEWIARERPELRFHFTFGYAMDHPELPRALDFLGVIGSVSGHFLQMNGFALRSSAENERLMREIFAHGVREVNFTFYGLEEYHDRFAGRSGDFEHLLIQIGAARRAGLNASAGVALTAENIGQAESLLMRLEENGIAAPRLFVPHGEGRGAMLEDIRVTAAQLEALPQRAKALLNRSVYRTEAEWVAVADSLPEPENRSLLISLTEENIGRFERMDFAEVIREVEALDDAYYRAVPSFAALAARYGDPHGEKLYGRRDLYQSYQKRYLRESGLKLYDVTDERFCGSRRY